MLFFIPPYTPEMNPVEQIWKGIRKRGFKNEIFSSLTNVIDRLCDTICSLSAELVKSITARVWILNCFISDQYHITVTFGLRYRKESPRIDVASESYPNRWTHHMLISSAEEIDDELMDWIREAAEFSAGKR